MSQVKGTSLESVSRLALLSVSDRRLQTVFVFLFLFAVVLMDLSPSGDEVLTTLEFSAA